MGDHGPPHGALQRMPLLTLLFSDDFPSRADWPRVRATLEANTHRLVTHKDLYSTMQAHRGME